MITILDAISLPARDRQAVAATAGRVLGAPARCTSSKLDLRPAFDASRRQYNSTVLLAQLLRLEADPADKLVAVVDVDLFIPVLTFVFGEAQLDGRAAIVSTARLRNEFYGLEGDVILERARLEKEVVHELGHTFGLLHCRQFECVMRSSTYVEEVDVKRVEMCAQCGKLLGERRAGAIRASRSGVPPA
jgi:archaemetzincin